MLFVHWVKDENYKDRFVVSMSKRNSIFNQLKYSDTYGRNCENLIIGKRSIIQKSNGISKQIRRRIYYCHILCLCNNEIESEEKRENNLL